MNLNIFNLLPINRTLAKIAGIQTATYWAQLMEVLPRVRDKKTYDSEGYFRLSRSFITEQIGMDLVEQYNCDSVLQNLGVLNFKPEDRDRIRVDSELMISIITNEDLATIKAAIDRAKLDTETVKQNKQAAKEKAKLDAKEIKTLGQIATMQHIAVTNFSGAEPVVIKALENWVDSIYRNGKVAFLTKQIIETFKTGLVNYTNDSSKQAAIVNIAASYGYRNIEWAINAYERNSTTKTTIGGVSTLPQKKAGEKVGTTDF